MKTRLWLKRTVSLVLLAWVVHTIATQDGVATLPERLSSARPEWLLLALALPVLAVLASVRRWQLLLRQQGVEEPFPWLLGCFLRGRFVGAFTPSTTGLDLYRLAAIARRHDRGAAWRTILVEKLYGLVALGVVTFALVPLGADRFFGAGGLLLAAVLGGGASLGLWLLARPGLLRGKHPKLDALANALASSPMPRATHLRVLLLGLGTHLLTAAIFVATGLAIDAPAGALDLLVVGNAIVLATLLPLSVGGVGVREGTAVLLLGTVGVPAADATLLALLGYLVAQPPALVGGASMLRPVPVLGAVADAAIVD